MTVHINRPAEPVFASYIERAKYKKQLERDRQYDREHSHRSTPDAEQRANIEYFFRTLVGPGEFV